MVDGVSGIINSKMVIRRDIEPLEKQIDQIGNDIERIDDQNKELQIAIRRIRDLDTTLRDLTDPINKAYNARKAEYTTTEYQGFGKGNDFVEVNMRGSQHLGHDFKISAVQKATQSKVTMEFDTDIRDKQSKLELNGTVIIKVGVDQGKHLLTKLAITPNDSIETIASKLNQLFKAHGGNYRAYAVGSSQRPVGIEIESTMTGYDLVQNNNIRREDCVFVGINNNDNVTNTVSVNDNNTQLNNIIYNDDDYDLNEYDHENKIIEVKRQTTSNIIYDEDDQREMSDDDFININDEPHARIDNDADNNDESLKDRQVRLLSFDSNSNESSNNNEDLVINNMYDNDGIRGLDEDSNNHLEDDLMIRDIDDDNNRIRGLDYDPEFGNIKSIYTWLPEGVANEKITFKPRDGKDSIIKINDNSYAHHSNTHKNIIPNCDITLKRENTRDKSTGKLHYQTITVVRDDNKLKKDIKKFIDAYNKLSDLYHTNLNPNISDDTYDDNYVLDDTAVLSKLGRALSTIVNPVKRLDNSEVNSLVKLGIELTEEYIEKDGNSYTTQRLRLVNPEKLTAAYKRDERVIENLLKDNIKIESKSAEMTGSSFALVQMSKRLDAKLYCQPINLKFDVKLIDDNDENKPQKISIENITLTTSREKNGKRVDAEIYSTAPKFDRHGNEIENKHKNFAVCENSNGFYYIEIKEGPYAGMRFTYIPGATDKDIQENFNITPQEGLGNKMRTALATLVDPVNPTKGAILGTLNSGTKQIAEDIAKQESLENERMERSDLIQQQLNFINQLTNFIIEFEKSILFADYK